MSIEFHHKSKDHVIDSIVLSGATSYRYALANLVPLINKLDIQRNIQERKFYGKLKRDLIDGCVMPPITIAFVGADNFSGLSLKQLGDFVNKNIQKAFILDGIQRLNTLKNAYEEVKNGKTFENDLFLNIILCKSPDKLLYRMITLNNGQRPMTPRHQVEILTANIFNFKKYKISILTEKEKSEYKGRNAFSKADFINAYIGFLTNSVTIENKKIIDEKMDQLLVGKIIDNTPIDYKLNFEDVLKLMEKHAQNETITKWLKISNNLIGFCVGIKESYKYIAAMNSDVLEKKIDLFEKAFTAINPSKVKVGKIRRELSCHYFKKIAELNSYDTDKLIEEFADLTAE